MKEHATHPYLWHGLPERVRLPVTMIPQPDETTCGPTCLNAIYRYWGEDERLLESIGRAPKKEAKPA